MPRDHFYERRLAAWPVSPNLLFFALRPNVTTVFRRSGQPLSALKLPALLQPFVELSEWSEPLVKSHHKPTSSLQEVMDSMRVFSTSSLLMLDRLPRGKARRSFERAWLQSLPLVPHYTTPSHLSLSAQVYISAPNGSAAPEHEDVGDGFVLQLLGEKTWHFAHSATAKETDRIATLSAGDALWLPATARHRTRASGRGPSLHLNLERGEPIGMVEKRGRWT